MATDLELAPAILPGLIAGAIMGGGALYGVGLFLAQDEMMAPLLGIAGPPASIRGRRTSGDWSRASRSES